MTQTRIVIVAILFAAGLAGTATAGPVFDGTHGKATDEYGYYYVVNGGKFQPGQTRTGDNASGGTMRFITDSPAWGYPIDAWQKDDWFSDNAGFAMTLKSGGSIVWDNNGIEDGSYGDYYTQGGSHGDHGLYLGYSMSNVWDWTYATYILLEQETTFDTIIGYFDGNGGVGGSPPFDPLDPAIGYQMNIYTEAADLLPTNTGAFTGDLFTTDAAGAAFRSGSFSVSDTGATRDFLSGAQDPIWRLVYTLDTPVTLAAGEYYFSHDAKVLVPLPAAAGPGLLLLAGAAGVALRRRRRARSV